MPPTGILSGAGPCRALGGHTPPHAGSCVLPLPQGCARHAMGSVPHLALGTMSRHALEAGPCHAMGAAPAVPWGPGPGGQSLPCPGDHARRATGAGLTFAAVGGDLGKGVVTAVAASPDDAWLALALPCLGVTEPRQGARGVAVAQQAGVAGQRAVVILLGGRTQDFSPSGQLAALHSQPPSIDQAAHRPPQGQIHPLPRAPWGSSRWRGEQLPPIQLRLLAGRS